MQRIAEPSGIKSANENEPWADYHPQAEALIRQRYGRFDMGTMFGARLCRLKIASTLWLVDRKMMVEETAKKAIEKAYEHFDWKLDYAKEVGWKPVIASVE
ncbi:MAG: hypothetical protein KDE26_08085 [Bacteroidetes bacterium]|nr:hypothetical protein [Bacteroidota bacterium]